MDKILLNAQIVNEGLQFKGHICILNDRISKILKAEDNPDLYKNERTEMIDCEGYFILPGLIDDQVHFREPGLTYKGDIESESRAAVAGGVTSYMEMPNTNPQTLTQELLEEKYALAAEKSLANYSFYMGASNSNLDEVLKTNPENVCGVKVFMGSSTGNMLVDNDEVLAAIFEKVPLLIAVHCEDEARIQQQTAKIKAEFGENPPVAVHPLIRDEEACYKSTQKAVDLAQKYNTRLHVLHLSTAKELSLFSDKPLSEKRITNEVCVHHLWFTDEDYAKYGTHIKWNPAIKSKADRDALREAVKSNRIDVVATDHAPHTLAEKDQSYFKAPSGGPLVQHSLVAMLEMVRQGVFTIEQVVLKMAHHPAELFGVKERGYIREGYFADLVVVDTNADWTVAKDNILYKCGWSPFEGQTFHSRVKSTFVNGYCVYNNGLINAQRKGSRLNFKIKK